jgi:hypothetical protein
MYLVNKEENNIQKIEKITFTQAGFKERKNLQEWIVKNPESLGEELLIIQKEFSGFDDTKERLDLLALDKEGNLVIVENKLDDTGRDVVWQALKYVSYCSGLSAQDIEQIFQEYLSKNNPSKNAKEILIDFFGNDEYQEILNNGYSQRIILVAANFRKEVTSTVMWLLNNGINVSCFKVTPYKLHNDVVIDFSQIIPLKEAEEYLIKIAEKQKEEVANKRLKSNRLNEYEKFWVEFLEQAKKKTALVQNNNPVKNTWIRVGLGVSGISLNLVISQTYARVEIYFNKGNKAENKKVFDYLFGDKKQIEVKLNQKLTWERMDDRVTSRIKWQLDEVSLLDEDDRKQMIKFLIDVMIKMHKVFSPAISKTDK